MVEENGIEPASTGGEHPSLIIVEDDPVTRTMVSHYFSGQGFNIREAGNGAECRILMKRETPDLVFIDIQLPDCNGLDLAQEIRALSPVGIIFVTQRNNETDKVVGLEMAGDDYVVKPINLRELLARARSLLRRRGFERFAAPINTVIAFGPWLLDLTRRELSTAGGGPIQLTRGEFDLLAALVAANGRPLGRDYLIEVVSNRDLSGDLRTVDSLVARLRRKLAPTAGGKPVIATVAGIGYRLGVGVISP